MRGRLAILFCVTLVLVVGGCAADGPAAPAAVPFTAVDLPAAAVPVVLSTEDDALLIGLRREGEAVVPGLLRREPDGQVTEVPVQPASPYGRLATWQSIASDGERLVALGGERGGAHGHVRWSVWSGSTSGAGAGVVEQVQGFSTFGGYAAGDLVGVVLTPAGPALVGGWESAKVGFDVAVWTADGDVWTRQSSAGTALESDQSSLGFPMAATALQQGILVAGWQLALDAGGRQLPAVWRSSDGNNGWTRSPLPDAGQAGAALAVRCWGDECGVAGRVDGKLAVWRLAGGAWARLGGAPAVVVGDRDRLAAPVEIDGRLVQLYSEGGQVKIARGDDGGWSVRDVAGPTGAVTAVALVGDAIYLVAGPDEATQTLWRADLAAVR